MTIQEYCEKNPIMMYADYRDELPDDMIEALLTGANPWDSAWDYEVQMQDSWFDYRFAEYANEAAKSLNLEPSDEFKEKIMESLVFDFSDYWKTCARNTRVKISLEPINPETGEGFGTVHNSLGFAENLSRARALNKYFGIRRYKAIESCYEHETLKIMGTIDLALLMESASPPTEWEITPQDEAIFHTSWNGSGCLGEVRIGKSCRIACNVRNDDNDRYGIDAVYGFTSAAWSTELTPIFKGE